MSESTARKTVTRQFSSYPPLAKIAIWIGCIVAVGATVQIGATLAGISFNVLMDGAGRTILICSALATLLALMALDQRSAAEYGLYVGNDWTRQFGGGLAAGMLFYGGYCAAGWTLGVFEIRTDSLSFYRVTTGFLAALTAIPLAATQQAIFSGYLMSTLKQSLGRIAAVLLSALLFAVLSSMGCSIDKIFSENNIRLTFGLLLIATLLNILRLQTGSIVLPASLLAGCIAVRRLLGKTRLLSTDSSHELADWMAPVADPRRGPVLWMLLGAAIVFCWWRLRRRGEPEVPVEQPLISTSFKRVFPMSNLMALAPLDLWLSALWDARFRIGWKYTARLIWILTASTANTILTLPERLILPWVLRHQVPDPVFIVGVHRSGTTHLHNLMARDSRFCTPRHYHVLNPLGTLLTGWLITPLLGAFMTMKRPMDAVRINMFSPQEEEFAVAGMTRVSPYWAFNFPRRQATYERYIFPEQMSGRDRKKWQRCMLYFARVLTVWRRKRPLMKSPYNTGRVAALREIFPRAKFVHIYREPSAVYRSNLHFAREGIVAFQLQDPDSSDSYASRFLDNYCRMEEAFYRDVRHLPAEDVAEVQFEKLEQDPLGELQRVYQQLGLRLDPKHERRLRHYLASISDYKKNRLQQVPAHESRLISAKMGRFVEQWGYGVREPAKRPDVA